MSPDLLKRGTLYIASIWPQNELKILPFEGFLSSGRYLKLLPALFLIVLLLVPIARAYCPPYFAKIDSIQPNYECLELSDETEHCGGAIEITNHCQGEFYFYDKQGNLDKSLVLVNYEDSAENTEKYDEREQKTGKHYTGSVFRDREPGFRGCQGERIVDGVNVCDESELEEAGSGTVVKHWTIRMYSEAHDQDILIKGRTVYDPPDVGPVSCGK